MDGSGGSDAYLLALSGSFHGQSSVYVADSGTGSTDSDSVDIWGGDVADTLHLDADTSLQQVVRTTAEVFTLAYGGEKTRRSRTPIRPTRSLTSCCSWTPSGKSS